MLNRIVNKVKAINAKFQDWNCAAYDKSQIAIMDEMVKQEMKQEANQRRIANGSSSYSNWYRKMLAVKQAREMGNQPTNVVPLVTSKHHEAAEAYLASL